MLQVTKGKTERQEKAQEITWEMVDFKITFMNLINLRFNFRKEILILSLVKSSNQRLSQNF